MARVVRKSFASKPSLRAKHTLHVRLTETEDKMIKRLAKRLKLDVSDTVRRALKELDESTRPQPELEALS